MERINDLTAKIWKEGDKFIAQCYELEELSSSGSTMQEALKNLKEITTNFFQDGKHEGDPAGFLFRFGVKENEFLTPFQIKYNDSW